MKLGLGILGTSNVAAKYIESGRNVPSLEIIGVYSRSPERAARFAHDHGLSLATSDLNKLLDHPSVNCVLVATEPARHLELALAALHRNKHTLIEKPLSLDLLSVKDFYMQIKNLEVITSVVSQKRFDPALQKMKEQIETLSDDPVLIDVKDFKYRDSSYYTHGNGWRNTDSHYFLNQGIHWIDVLLWFWGDPISVKSFCTPKQRSLGCSDRGVAVIRWSNGSLATVSGGSFSHNFKHERLTVYGTHGTINDRDYVAKSQGRWSRIFERAMATGFQSFRADTLFDLQVADFCSAIRESRPPQTTVENSIRALNVALSVEGLIEYSPNVGLELECS
ncbi:Gfo/Idh/MocA family oxidoreductase [Gammaproteobacteria bacterium]|nr:Gfo/Idh/MocA family oxidoreductase [Gammaproteobacteria bacterium]